MIFVFGSQTGGKKKKKEPHPLAHKFIDGAALAQSTLEDINAQSLALFSACVLDGVFFIMCTVLHSLPVGILQKKPTTVQGWACCWWATAKTP